MAPFRRRPKPTQDSGLDDADQLDPTQLDPDDAHPEPQAEAGRSFDRSSGPFDVTEQEFADQDLARIDLGSLLIPGLPGIGVQVEADPQTQQVRAVTAVGEQAAVQLQAFAAPRSGGLWDEIRAEMVEELTKTSGAQVSLDSGSFGPEVRAVLPGRTAEGQQVAQPVRFVGIEGPRWFLRAVFLGRAALEPDPADDLHRLVLQTIVVRGGDAMPPRDPLPLTLPEDAVADGQDPEDELDDDPQEDYADLDPFERGPEITETR